MKSAQSYLIKFLIIFIISTLVVTLFFIFIFNSSSASVNISSIFKIVKQFSLVISIPTSIIFFLIDFIIQKIKIKWVLYLVRGVVLFSLLYLVSLFFSLYLISSALLNNPAT